MSEPSDTPENIFSINVNYDLDYSYTPDWRKMTKSEYLIEWGSGEEEWNDMVAAGAIVGDKASTDTPKSFANTAIPDLSYNERAEEITRLRAELAAAKEDNRNLNEAFASVERSHRALRADVAALDQFLESDACEDMPPSVRMAIGEFRNIITPTGKEQG